MEISTFRMSCIRLATEAVLAQLSSFESEWSDEVHDSYIEFNEIIRRSANKINDEAKQCSDELDSIIDIDVSALISESEETCQMALSF